MAWDDVRKLCDVVRETLVSEHVAQVLGYLRASRMKDALLINFGAGKLQIRKYVL